MATNREMALQQALVVLIGAAYSRALNVEDLLNHSATLLLGNNMLRRVDHPHVDDAIREISNAHAEVLTIIQSGSER
ncbi:MULTISPECIES: hypothetical protein [Pseudomonas syringae group]|uniref:hypothetical protein n=1 Tax=Pseudomonas syringae group TaxID=136849 RepID=UPI0011C48A4B|nr:hypothetical protein [Pseudomonas coronafaciens]